MSRGPDTWSKPDDGWVKVNSDGALAKHQGSGGGGAVLRNNHGEFIVGACHFFPLAADAETVELLACRRAVILAQELNIQRLILETDSQVAVRKISSEQKDLSGNGQIVEELKTLLSTFSGFRIAWVRQSANKVAHILAREGCKNFLCKTWLHVPPECLSSEITADVSAKF